jgi:hypothetical protein
MYFNDPVKEFVQECSSQKSLDSSGVERIRVLGV